MIFHGISRKNWIIHTDGAIRSYNQKDYQKRTQNITKSIPKGSKYQKLWRIDGEISIDLWKSLITQYFRDNYMIGEYFNGVDEIIEKKDLNKIQNDFQKFDFFSNLGMRMILSYFFKEKIEYSNTYARIFELNDISKSLLKSYFEEISIHAIFEDVRNENEKLVILPDFFYIENKTNHNLKMISDLLRKCFDHYKSKGKDFFQTRIFFIYEDYKIKINLIGRKEEFEYYISNVNFENFDDKDKITTWFDRTQEIFYNNKFKRIKEYNLQYMISGFGDFNIT